MGFFLNKFPFFDVYITNRQVSKIFEKLGKIFRFCQKVNKKVIDFKKKK